MRMKLCVRAAVTAGIALGGYMVPSSISFGIIGVDTPEAAQFYTRKRVNGVWIHGRFPKSDRSSRAASAKKSERTKASHAVTEVPASATLAALPPPNPQREIAKPSNSPSVTGSLPEPTSRPAALPDVEAALVTAAVGPVPPAGDGGTAAEERLVRLRRALEARADKLKATITPESASIPAPQAQPVVQAAVTATNVPAPAPAPQPARPATTWATSTAAAASSAVAPPAAAAPAKTGPLVPRSVSFDFETGIKTTVFENSVVREPFDPAMVRGLTVTR